MVRDAQGDVTQNMQNRLSERGAELGLSTGAGQRAVLPPSRDSELAVGTV